MKPPGLAALRQAEYLFDAALEAYVSGEHRLALQRLSQALRANPALAEDERFGKLVSEIMHVPPEQAVQTLLDEEQRGAIIAAAAPSPRPKRQRSPARKLISRILLVVSSLILIALATWFVDSGRLKDYWRAYKIRQVTRDIQRLPNGQEYYVMIPGGGAPPKNGWDVLVALLYGFSRGGRSRLPF
jgi:hypothetical protein